jgi:uncharacterized LabA/DUF88 family protein
VTAFLDNDEAVEPSPFRRITVEFTRTTWRIDDPDDLGAPERINRSQSNAAESAATMRGYSMHFYPNERLAVFIDGANLYATAKALGFDIDYKRLLALFRTKGQLVRALYYTALAEDQEYTSLRPLVDWLDYNGFTMVTKPTKEFTDALGRRKIKGNMDIELTVDAMRLVEHLDHVILFTGDGDFRALVAAMQQRGRRVSVVSTLQTQPPMVADELRRQADQFIDLADLEDQICRDPATRPMREPSARPARRPPAPVASRLEYPEEEDQGGGA